MPFTPNFHPTNTHHVCQDFLSLSLEEFCQHLIFKSLFKPTWGKVYLNMCQMPSLKEKKGNFYMPEHVQRVFEKGTSCWVFFCFKPYLQAS